MCVCFYVYECFVFTTIQGPVLIASSQGGVNIEEVAAENPDAILYEPIDIVKGLSKEQAVKIAEKVGLADVSETISQTLLNMYELFIKKDALLIEINPYAEDAFDTSKCEYKYVFKMIESKFILMII